MSKYIIIRTDTFIENLKQHKKDKKLLSVLRKKIEILKENSNVGKYLSKKLYPSKSVRLNKKFRLIFQINEKEEKVYLEALDHRQYVYE